MPNYTVEALRTIRAIQRSHEKAGHTFFAEQMRKIGDQVEAMADELAALREAVMPVVEWYTRSKRHFPDEFRPCHVVLDYDGPSGRIRVICRELDALAALVGEELK